jgi:hypothetical protein
MRNKTLKRKKNKSDNLFFKNENNYFEQNVYQLHNLRLLLAGTPFARQLRLDVLAEIPGSGKARADAANLIEVAFVAG